ncbi:MAG: hypothetical protein NXH75_08700 [Halobacteriovoraceae bacterium]|nr:hypothetical protein [Halobacteriovoraceae bacterium]
MKRIIVFLPLFILLSCATQKPAATTAADRGPASVKAPTFWGNQVAPDTEEFLEEIENAPAQKYQ